MERQQGKGGWPFARSAEHRSAGAKPRPFPDVVRWNSGEHLFSPALPSNPGSASVSLACLVSSPQRPARCRRSQRLLGRVPGGRERRHPCGIHRLLSGNDRVCSADLLTESCEIHPFPPPSPPSPPSRGRARRSAPHRGRTEGRNFRLASPNFNHPRHQWPALTRRIGSANRQS